MTDMNEDGIRQQTQRKQGELRQLIGDLHRVLVEQLETVGHVSAQFATLSERIETHFKEEEAGGFFDQVLGTTSKSQCVASLRDEHQRLLQAVHQINDRAKSGNGSDDWWRRLESEFRKFSKDFMEHEHKENQLLQDAYEQDSGTAD